jgi:hypothetical protein
MSVVHLPECPTTCAGGLGIVEFNDCAPEIHYGEITRLYLWALDDVPFATHEEFSTMSHWNNHLNNDDVAPTTPVNQPIRYMTVIGDMPEPEQTETPISGDRIVYGFKKFVLNLEIDETNEHNYEFLLLSECGGKYKAVFETADGMVYGGWQGLEVTLKMNQVIPRERTAVVKIMLRVTWTSRTHPLREFLTIA